MPVQRFFEAPDGTFSYLDWGGDGPLTHIAHATGFCAGVYDPLAQMLVSRLVLVEWTIADTVGHLRQLTPNISKAGTLLRMIWEIFSRKSRAL